MENNQFNQNEYHSQLDKYLMPKQILNLGSVISSVNSSTKSQLKKLNKVKIDKSLPRVNYADIYFYSNKKWNLKGKGCMLCNTIMNDPYVLDNHHYVCEVNIQKNKYNGTD